MSVVAAPKQTDNWLENEGFTSVLCTSDWEVFAHRFFLDKVVGQMSSHSDP